ncbi:unnamed protein product, partial [Closterium sp. NIES-53]
PPVTSLLDLLRPNERFLAFLPRHGLGNSLRGFVSAFVYASLAGRRLVRLHAGEHARVYDLLCQAYGCSFDAVGQPGGVDRGGEEDGSGGDGAGGEEEDGDVGDEGKRSAGGALGDGADGRGVGAREGVGVREEKGARRGLMGDVGAEGAVEVVRSASEGRSGTGVELLRKFAMLRPIYFLERYQNVQSKPLHSRCPLFRPLRTISAAVCTIITSPLISPIIFPIITRIASIHTHLCPPSSFRSVWCVHSRAMFAFLSRTGPTPALTSTISSVLRRVPHNSSSEGRKNSSNGRESSTQDKDSSTGSSSSSSSSSGSTADPAAAGAGAAAASSIISEPAHAGPEIEFDVGFHVRTRTLALEKVVRQSGDTYQDADCQDPEDSPAISTSTSSSSTGSSTTSASASATSPRPRFLRNCLWECIGGILSTLRSMRDDLPISTTTDPSNSRGGSSSSSSSSEFSIFLATDDEEHRAEFVARLAEYGTVFFSSGGIFHTSKAGGSAGSGNGSGIGGSVGAEGLESSSLGMGVEGNNESSSSGSRAGVNGTGYSSATIPERVTQRLPTMAEFFLLSKARTIIEAGSYISTFAYFAGLLGNGTLSSVDMKSGQCRLHHEHVAQGMFG